MMNKDTRPYLYFVPVGGLGNRLRAVASAVRLAEDFSADMRIGWFLDWGMGARFSDIFQSLRFDVRDERRMAYYTLDRPRKKNLFIPLLFEKAAFDRCLYENVLGYEQIDFTFLRDVRKVWMASCKAFYKDDEADYGIFRPIPLLQTEIDAVVSSFDGDVVSVQIRRTDHVTAVRQSLTEDFERIIDSLPYDTRVYVASDDALEKKRLAERYGEKIITRECVLDRGRVRGIQDAVVEMFVMAATKRIYGSKDSSFSQVAARIGNVDLMEVSRQ